MSAFSSVSVCVLILQEMWNKKLSSSEETQITDARDNITSIDQRGKKKPLMLFTQVSLQIEIVLFSACIWYTISIIRAVFLCNMNFNTIL